MDSFGQDNLRGCPGTDIEATYLDLVGGNSWDGIAPLPAQSSFWADCTINADDYEREARALAAKSKLPWDVWVKLYADCHHRKKRGHIRPNCPDYIKKIHSQEIQRPYRPIRNQPRPTNRSAPPARRQPFLTNSKKAKAFLSAFNALFTDDDNNNETAVDVDNNSGLQDCDEQEANDAVDVDVYNFLAKIVSLKD